MAEIKDENMGLGLEGTGSVKEEKMEEIKAEEIKEEDIIPKIQAVLETHFEAVQLLEDSRFFYVTVGARHAKVDIKTREVVSSDPEFQKRVFNVFARICGALLPVSMAESC